MRIAGVEIGGTKAIALLWQAGAVVARVTMPTTQPDETLGRLHRQLAAWHRAGALDALGIASFGPLALARSAPGFGAMLATPKPGWTGAPVMAALTAGLACPAAIDTDVNGAALAEYRWGAGAGCDSLCYLTVGTGVGGGVLIGGRPLHGALHPEVGHLRIRRLPGDGFAGTCPFHGDCVEGLVSGPALAARFGCDPATVGPDHPVWTAVAADLAELAAALFVTLAPQRLLIGGGVGTGRPFLLPLVRERAVALLGGYLPYVDEVSAALLIREPALGADAGPLGAIALGLSALQPGSG
ncbi:ROK family protein [Sphingomonas flavalba]|uniref:ROK family protein n=1 Tax=Sphingomonas flavalba TaxID=2559804 RepID=UPI0039E12764